MKKIADLRGHTSRVLHLAISPDGTTVASAAADETLRFWKVFQPSTHLSGCVTHKAGSSNVGSVNMYNFLSNLTSDCLKTDDDIMMSDCTKLI